VLGMLYVLQCCLCLCVYLLTVSFCLSMYVYPLNAFFQKMQWIDVHNLQLKHTSAFHVPFNLSLDQSVVSAASPESSHGIGLLMIT